MVLKSKIVFLSSGFLRSLYISLTSSGSIKWRRPLLEIFSTGIEKEANF